MTNPDRFLGRAEAYAAARPTYPDALGAWLKGTGLLAGRVADVGAGTGLFTRLLLAHGAHVDAVEPNPEMRAYLAGLESAALTVHAGTSEDTGLPPASVGLVTAAQAAHWFSPEPTVREFRRVLNPGGRVLFVWNDWRGVDTPFNRAYGGVVRTFLAGGTPDIATRVPEAELPQFFPGGFSAHEFDNEVRLTREKLRALAGSVSYLPSPGSPDYPALTAALDAIHAEGQGGGGEVVLTYRTHAFLGRLD